MKPKVGSKMRSWFSGKEDGESTILKVRIQKFIGESGVIANLDFRVK